VQEEGIVVKKLGSPYMLGVRSDSWVKLKPQ
jgi:ATP-dependent DNA ligase